VGETAVSLWRSEEHLYLELHCLFLAPQHENCPFSPLSAQTTSALVWGASFWWQVWLAHNRFLLQGSRQFRKLLKELLVAVALALLIGFAFRGPVADFNDFNVREVFLSSSASGRFRPMTLSLIMCVCVAFLSSDSTTVFAPDRPIYWRETSRGHSLLAFYLGVSLGAMERMLLVALHFTTVYHSVAQHVLPFNVWVGQFFALLFCGHGIALAFAMIMSQSEAAIMSTGTQLLMATFNGYVISFPSKLKQIFPTFWFGESFFVQSVLPYCRVWQCDEALAFFEYSDRGLPFALTVIVAMGIMYRVLAFVLMAWMRQDR